MRRVYEVSGERDQFGTFHPPDENEMMRKLLAIREHLEDFGGILTVVPKRVRITDEGGATLRFETWGLIFRYDSSAPAAEMQEGEPPEPEVVAEQQPELEVEPEAEPALAE